MAQGTLAFVMPPAIAVTLARRKGSGQVLTGGEIGQFMVGIFGVFVVLSTSYYTAVGVGRLSCSCTFNNDYSS